MSARAFGEIRHSKAQRELLSGNNPFNQIPLKHGPDPILRPGENQHLSLSSLAPSCFVTSIVLTVGKRHFTVKALVDSGAQSCFIDKAIVAEHNIKIEKIQKNILLNLADGTPSSAGPITHTTTPVQLTLAGHKEKARFYVSSIAYPVILGLNWLQTHNPTVNWKKLMLTFPDCRIPCPKEIPLLDKPTRISLISLKEIKRSEDPVLSMTLNLISETTNDVSLPVAYKEFEDVFSKAGADKLPPHRIYDHSIPIEGDQIPPFGPIYGLNEKELKACWEYLQENLEKDFIRKSQSPCAAPILFVKKKDGSLRLCVDYRKLNAVTVKNKYPLPLIPELLDRLKGAAVYTCLDLRGAYNLVRIKEGEQWKTAFRTRYGLYEYNVMPFGLCNAPATFQFFINEALGDLLDKCATAYLDDILIYSKDVEQHERDVKEVLNRLRKYSLFVKLEKCLFSQSEVPFLGFIIGSGHIKMDPSKVDVVRDWPTPNSVLDIQTFLGFANFYRRFIKNFSLLTKPITSLLKKDCSFNWGRAQEEAFSKLKEAFTSSPILHTFDSQLDTVLETDASDYALGAILSQVVEGQTRPVAYYSRSFTPPEMNYEIHDKELLAIVTAFKEFRQYLSGTSKLFTVLTDHKNLEYFNSSKVLNQRQIRWSQLLADYDFVIKYRAGAENCRADALSRRSDMTQNQTALPNQIFKAGQLQLCTAGPELSPTTLLEQIREGYNSDTVSCKLMNSLGQQVNIPPYSLRNGLIYFESQVYVPDVESIQVTILELFHDSPCAGHFGQAKTFELVSREFYWSGMRKFINSYLRSCDVCNRTKSSRHVPYGQLKSLPIAEKPWASISMDFVVDLPISNGFDSIWVVVDRLTKYAHFVPINKTITADQLSILFLKEIFCFHGIPHDIVSDRGSIFTSKFWRRFTQLADIKSNLSTAFHPQTDGQTERVNQIMEQYLRVYVNYQQDDWCQLLPLAQFAYNNSLHTSTKTTPFYANHGFNPSFNILKHDTALVPKAEDRINHIQAVHESLKQNIAKANADMALYYDKSATPSPPYKLGDFVWLSHHQVKTQRPSQKLDSKQLGPFRIIRCISAVAFKLELPPTMKIHPVFHVSHLLPYTTSTISRRKDPIPPPVIVDHVEEFVVKRILDSRRYRRKLQYLIEWEGYSSEHNSWEPASATTSCAEKVSSFHRKYPSKPS
jgi:hypothetical protein